MSSVSGSSRWFTRTVQGFVYALGSSIVASISNRPKFGRRNRSMILPDDVRGRPARPASRHPGNASSRPPTYRLPTILWSSRTTRAVGRCSVPAVRRGRSVDAFCISCSQRTDGGSSKSTIRALSTPPGTSTTARRLFAGPLPGYSCFWRWRGTTRSASPGAIEASTYRPGTHFRGHGERTG